MGIQCCPLPTAVLSAHTAFPAAKSASFLDLTPEMEQGTRHWRELGMDFDAIYSGFLGSARQISVLRQFIHDFRREDTLVLVDPVMGDHGKVYRTYTPEMCRLMGELAAQADLITPNAPRRPPSCWRRTTPTCPPLRRAWRAGWPGCRWTVGARW